MHTKNIKPMNKILTCAICVVGLLSCVACSKNDADTTYTIKCLFSATADDSIKWDVTAFEYNAMDESVWTHLIPQITNGVSRQFVAGRQTVKVKIHLKMYYATNTSSSQKAWVQQVYYLTSGKDTLIELRGDTMLGDTEP